jgi:hypothetical protein
MIFRSNVGHQSENHLSSLGVKKNRGKSPMHVYLYRGTVVQQAIILPNLQMCR